jgi:hypothetical protein
MDRARGDPKMKRGPDQGKGVGEAVDSPREGGAWCGPIGPLDGRKFDKGEKMTACESTQKGSGWWRRRLGAGTEPYAPER